MRPSPLRLMIRAARWGGQHPLRLIAPILVLAALCRAALTDDGSYYLFSLLANGQAMVPNHRMLHAVLPLPALWASRVSGDISMIALIFNLAYTLMPLAALLTAASVARGRRGQPFLWAVVGVCVVTLPGQIVFISEGSVALQWAWSLWIACAYGVRRRDLPLLVPVCLVIGFSHPTGPLLFGIGAGLAALRGWQLRQQGRHELRISLLTIAILLVLAGLNALRVALAFNAYELEQVSSFTILVNRFGYSVVGVQAIMLIGAFGLLAGGVFRTARHRFWQLGGMVLVIACGGVYALVPRFWASAIDYRFFVLGLSLPFVGLMACDAFRLRPRVPAWSPAAARRLIGVFVLTFALVVGLQSVEWALLRAGVRSASPPLLANGEPDMYPCVGIDGVPLGQASILYHWSITPLSLLEGGQKPTQLVLWAQPCTPAAFAAGMPVTPWETQPAGWFEWADLLARLQATPPW